MTGFDTSSTNPYPTGAGRPPNVCGRCGAQWWDTHVCPVLSTGPIPSTPQFPSIQVPSVFLKCSVDPEHGVAMSNVGGELICAGCLAEFKAWLQEKRGKTC